MKYLGGCETNLVPVALVSFISIVGYIICTKSMSPPFSHCDVIADKGTTCLS